MKLAISIPISDLIPIPGTFYENIIRVFDKKAKLFRSSPKETIFQSLKKVGIDSVELLICLKASDRHIAQAKELLTTFDISVASIHQSLSNKSSITLEEIERLCRIARSLSASVVVLHSEALGKSLFDLAFVGKLSLFQQIHGISFGIENMAKTPFTRDSFIYKATEFSSIVRRTGSFITFDITHMGQAGDDILRFFEANKDKIINIHISDCLKSWINQYVISQAYTHLPLGHGQLPIDSFLKLIKKEKYSGQLTLEVNSNLEQICRSVTKIRNLLF